MGCVRDYGWWKAMRHGIIRRDCVPLTTFSSNSCPSETLTLTLETKKNLFCFSGAYYAMSTSTHSSSGDCNYFLPFLLKSIFFCYGSAVITYIKLNIAQTVEATKREQNHPGAIIGANEIKSLTRWSKVLSHSSQGPQRRCRHVDSSTFNYVF